MEKFCIPEAVTHCCGRLRAAGHEAYPVGGCVRDMLLGRTPGDWDITTAARPEEVMRLFPRTVPTGLAHGTVTVLLDGLALEVTTFRREGNYSDGRHPDGVTFDADLAGDLSRRDFTVNAMALGAEGEIIDPFGGGADLQKGQIRCVGDPDLRFGEDALRMLRALRFAAQLGFSVEGDTLAALARNSAKICHVSAERVTAELQRTLLSPRPEWAMTMARLGLLRPYLPPGEYPAMTPTDCGPVPRFSAFCAATGLSIQRLPVPRALRLGVLHPERRAVQTLALTGGELYALGLRGGEIGRAQRALAEYVKENPGENTREALLQRMGAGGIPPAPR